MTKQQCEYHDASLGRRIRGPRCRRVALWKMWPRNGEGSISVCDSHMHAINRRASLQCESLKGGR